MAFIEAGKEATLAMFDIGKTLLQKLKNNIQLYTDENHAGLVQFTKGVSFNEVFIFLDKLEFSVYNELNRDIMSRASITSTNWQKILLRITENNKHLFDIETVFNTQFLRLN